MSKIITWRTPEYSENPAAHETDSLYYAEGVVRYVKFESRYSLKFCLADALRYTKGDQYITVPPGAFYITNRGAEMECLPGKPGGRCFFVYFTDDLLLDVHRNRTHTDAAMLDDPLRGGDFHFFSHIYRYPNPVGRQLQILSQRLAVSNTPQFIIGPGIFYDLAESLFALQQDISRQVSRLPARTPATREELYRRLLLAREFMYDHRSANLSLSDIARCACLSPYHFHRSFREAFGQAPMSWLRQIKLEKAQEMLATGRWSVTEVALHCGFSDVFSFSRAFKRERGKNPSKIFPVL